MSRGLAGVSQATVSRVLNDSANVTPRLRGRVLRALDQTGYRPNALAQAMKTGRTGTIGVVIAGIANPFYPELLGTIGRQLAAAGHRMILWETECAGEQSAIEAIQQGLVDGVMFTTVMPGAAAVAEASRRGAPMVLSTGRCPESGATGSPVTTSTGPRWQVGTRSMGAIDGSGSSPAPPTPAPPPGSSTNSSWPPVTSPTPRVATGWHDARGRRSPDGHRGRQRRHRVRRAGRGPCPWRGRA